MRYAQIRKMDISDGIGIRVTIYTQGCDIRCENCYNSEIWDYNGGSAFNEKVKNNLLDMCDKPYIQGLSVLGGEPLSNQNLDALKDLFMDFKKRYPEKDIWMWTGHVYEHLTPEQKEVANLVDVLVDGPFIDAQKDLTLKFRGSKNQRVIDIKNTIKNNSVIELEK